MAVTLQQIADQCGVCKMTVSRVLSGKDPGKVSDAVRERVLRAADALHYRPNVMATRFRNGAHLTPNLTMLLPCPGFQLTLRSEGNIYWEVFHGVFEMAASRGSSVEMLAVSRSNDPADIEWSWLDKLGTGSRVLAYSSWFLPVLPVLAARGCRIALIHSQMTRFAMPEEARRDWALFTMQRRETTRKQVERLLAQGFRRIALASAYLREPGHPLAAGYRETLEAHGNAFRCEIAPPETLSGSRGIEEAYHETPFDALLIQPQRVCYDYAASIQRNYGIPDEVKIVFTDESPDCDRFRPHIESAGYPMQQIGRDAATLLLDNDFVPGERLYPGTLIF